MAGSRLSPEAASAISWLGLALMTASFAVLVMMSSAPSPPRPVIHAARPQPFNVVVLDPGHGGQDSGAVAPTIAEKDVTLDIARRVERLLAAQGMASVLTRLADSYVPLSDRAAVGNRIKDAIFVSIHCNDGLRTAASGVETYFAAHRPAPGAKIASWFPFIANFSSAEPDLQSQSLAGFIQQELVRTGAFDRGTKAEQFYVLANVQHPAVLIEAGFLTNAEEVAKLADANYREQLASAIVSGIVKYRQALQQRASNGGNVGAE